MIIQADKLTKVYGTQKALDAVSFTVEKPQVVGLLGPNGAGKSTLMKILCCYLPATSGSIRVDGLDPRKDSLQIRARIGYLPEHNPLYGDMYVREYLDFVGEIYMERAKVVSRREEVIRRVGFGQEADKKIRELSKGYRQRLGLAQALIHDPGILVLDEPTSGLDPNQLEDVRALIREIGKEKTVFLSTHIMQEAEAVCERVLLLDRGVLVADAATADLMRGMQGEMFVCVEFDVPVQETLLKGIEGVRSIKRISPARFEIGSEASMDLRPLLFRFAVDNGISVLTMQQESRSLESVFHQLTGNPQRK